ncbi:MAG: bifunctional phosphopantothenoylcysteine decarboxylase/phosphopantothenate--cysteine ligase CoaBC [Alphaproteobacteria bacterium]|nr:bifunctional phosphopantothenoylcysteine decarboxylase/phosphopantothenate--cysteine ligase CoaBC [Alphaproteobacteria bacterium]
MITNALFNRSVLLIISGGIAAYKSLELIRRLRDGSVKVRCVLTQGGAQFVTPLSVSALSEEQVYGDLWSLTDEHQMGHIRLAREADLIVVAPASANLIAKMAQGLADDLASTVLLATDKPVLLAPAMNGVMWQNPATQANIATLKKRGVKMIGPASGTMACGEEGEGRMSEPAEILAAITKYFSVPGPLSGKRALVTSGPTHEPIDPVRFIGNRSSGKQGHAIAEALARQGAETILVTGPVTLPDPAGIKTIRVQTAQDMLAACETALPVDVAVCAAAVADWRTTEISSGKLKKGVAKPTLELAENPDILARLSKAGNRRPRLVIGFAAETDDPLKNAARKLDAKGCDWLVANDVSNGKVFDQDDNEVTFLRRSAPPQTWPRQSKEQVARQLVQEIVNVLTA